MNTIISRRAFVGDSFRGFVSAGLVGLGVQESASQLRAGEEASKKREDGSLPIVDTHQHLWDLTKFKLPWVERVSPLAKSYVMKDYLAATAGLHVVKAVYMEVDVKPAQQLAEAEYITAICKSGKAPTVAGVISGRPASADFKKYVTRFKDSPYIKGLRQVLHNKGTPAGYCLQPAFVKGVQLLGDLGLSFDLCMRSTELLDAKKLVESCPGTRFILDHCGNANVQAKDRTQWRKDMARIAKCKNLVGKVSGIVASAKKGKWTADDLSPIINHTLEVFGPDRVMFGGDWPVCTLAATYKQWVTALKAIVKERKERDRKKLFHDNAVKFYGLK
jgi:predicted TIM-barrel fold metal-dependent hydrolase